MRKPLIVATAFLTFAFAGTSQAQDCARVKSHPNTANNRVKSHSNSTNNRSEGAPKQDFGPQQATRPRDTSRTAGKTVEQSGDPHETAITAREHGSGMATGRRANLDGSSKDPGRARDAGSGMATGRRQAPSAAAGGSRTSTTTPSETK